MMQHHQEALAARALDGVTPVRINRRFGAVSRAEMLCRLRPQMAAREDRTRFTTSRLPDPSPLRPKSLSPACSYVVPTS